jgi:CRISPR-associated protein Cmr2
VSGINCWLSFSLTPVQKFIEAARTVRDLKTGSELLCYLVGRAIDEGIDHYGGTLLFPVLKTDPRRNIPNQFVMGFARCDVACAAAPALRAAVTTAWSDLADRVHAYLDGLWQPISQKWDQDWDRQINSYWDIRVVVLCPDHYDTLSTAPVLPVPDSTRDTSLKPTWDLLAAALNAAKQVRHFPGEQGKGRDKCAIMGGLEQMGPGGLLKDQAAFWRAAVRRPQGRLRLEGEERLCAIALVKRFVSAIAGPGGVEAPLRNLNATVPDTAAIAVRAWQVRTARKPFKAAMAAFTAAADILDRHLEQIGIEGRTSARYLLADRLTVNTLLKDMPAPERATHVPALQPLVSTLATACGTLKKRTRDQGLTFPSRYLAILELDGDEMGKRLGGDARFCAHGDLTLPYYDAMSRELRTYAHRLEQPGGIVDRHYGYSIYAGGDDALALLPLETALKCAMAMRAEYPRLDFSLPNRASASAGLVICHYLDPLRESLESARQSLQQAKAFGRDACAISLLKRSGGALQVVLSWKLVQQVNALADLFRRGASDRWTRRLAEIVPAISDTSQEAQVETLIRHFVRRTQGSDDSSAERVIRAASRLWIDLCRFLHERHDRIRLELGNDPGVQARFPLRAPDTRAEVGFYQQALATYLDAIGLASFLQRGE